MPEIDQLDNIMWVLIATAMVMLMQGGFTLLESGLVHSKNGINVAMKNFVDFCFSSAMFWAFGFAIMFGASNQGWFGTTGFFFDDSSNPWLAAFFIFQLVFAGTATTIVSGAVAERMRFSGYLIASAIIAGLIYPVLGHWVWGGLDKGTATGWLAQIGFIDFAGATVVHSVGGWMALAAVIIIGPRMDRFKSGRTSLGGHDLPLTTLGALLLWFGWFGFNGGSTFGLTDEIPFIIANTVLAGAFGGLAALILISIITKKADVVIIINGSLAGLVAITASANIMSIYSAVWIGLIAGILSVFGTLMLERFEIDDVVGAVPVHALGGAWGTLAVAIFANPAAWGTNLARWQQLLVQAAGVSVTFLWAFGLGYLLLWMVNKVVSLRVTEEEERLGLNISEHATPEEMVGLLDELIPNRQQI